MMPQSETQSNGDDNGCLCCCLGSSRDKVQDQPVTLIKNEPITSQPNSQTMSSPRHENDQPMNGIRTRTAEESIDGFEEVELEMRNIPIQHSLPPPKELKDGFNITDIHIDALCTEEESGEQIVEDEPDISANVIEEIDEIELRKISTRSGFPSVTKETPNRKSDEELTFKQMMAEDYERRKKELLKEIESAEEQDKDSNRSFLNLEFGSEKGSSKGIHIEPSPSTGRVEEINKFEDRPSTSASHEDLDLEEKKEEMKRKKSQEEQEKEIEKKHMEQQLLNEIETLDLHEITNGDEKWDEKRQQSERELKKNDQEFKEVIAQLSVRSGEDTDVEESDEEEDEVMIDRHTETLPVDRAPVSQMYSKMSESEDESDEEEREVIVPPPRKAHQQKTAQSVLTSDDDSGNGNTRPDSSSEKENSAKEEVIGNESSQGGQGHITRVSLKSNGMSTVVVDGGLDGESLRVSLDPRHPHETTITDDEFSEKLI